MDRLAELASRLTPTQLREVEDFAEFLAKRPSERRATPATPHFLDVEKIAGMCVGIGGGLSDVEVVHAANEASAAKYD